MSRTRTHSTAVVTRALAALLLLSLCLGDGVRGPGPALAAEGGYPGFPLDRVAALDIFDPGLLVGDVNNDGLLDLVSGERRSAYLNDGSGGYPGTPELVRPFADGADRPDSLVLGDMNGDGALDIVVGNNFQQNVIYLNDGAGFFPGTEQYVRPYGNEEGLTNSFALADVNSDGHLDIISANAPHYNSECMCLANRESAVHYNDGTGAFSDAASSRIGLPEEELAVVAAADIDGDGYIDVATVASDGTSVVYLNDRQGGFPATPEYSRGFNPGQLQAQQLVLADFNGDDALDIAAVHEGQDLVRVYLNDGAGAFPATSLSTVTLGPYNLRTRRIAVADMDGDGNLDIVAGNQREVGIVYLNPGDGRFSLDSLITFGTANDFVEGVQVGDLNNDRSLDIIASTNQLQKLYLHDRGGYYSLAEGSIRPVGELGVANGRPFSFNAAVAAGDIDNDQDIDIALGNRANASAVLNRVYLNSGRGEFSTDPAGFRTIGDGRDAVSDLALADLNGDGHLDVVIVNAQEDRVYLNDRGGNFPATGGYVRTLPGGPDDTRGVAVGDLDNDGDLDLVLGNAGQSEPNRVYLNAGDATFTQVPDGLAPAKGEGEETFSVALGDVDNDGSLDIIVASRGLISAYLNDRRGRFQASSRRTIDADPTRNGTPFSLGVSDLNGDGALDIVVGNFGSPDMIYLNRGDGSYGPGAAIITAGDTAGALAVGDMNGDGAADLVVGGSLQQGVVYIGDGAGGFPEAQARPFGFQQFTDAVELADLDQDGALDIVAVHGGIFGPSLVYLNTEAQAARRPNNPPTIAIAGAGVSATPLARPEILEGREISVTYTLRDLEGDEVREVRAYYSPSGGGQWFPAVAAAGSITANLAASPAGVTHTFVWDTFASGFFGQADNLVLRLVAFPGSRPSRDGAPPALERPYAAAASFPFRVRGTQVRVLAAAGEPVPGATVLRLSAEGAGATAITAGGAGDPLTTDGQGYLQGRGELARGDRLVALAPRIVTDTYTLYHTSAPVAPDGPRLQAVAEPGVQTLAVSPENPLLLFNLDVALEWDARADPNFEPRLREDLMLASRLLYDWTDGQVALGEVTVFHDARRATYDGGWDLWSYGHLRIYATNRLRPNANQGGVVIGDTADPDIASITYTPGQVRMGALWNRYGDSDDQIGEDWARTLAHELGHYLLFLDDNYLGLQDGIVVPVSGCPGAMSDPYSDANSELVPPGATWEGRCLSTLSERETGRADWETIRRLYPDQLFGLRGPEARGLDYNGNPGPPSLPLAVTRVRFVGPEAPAQALPDPIFSLVDAAGAPVAAGSSARAYHFPAGSEQIVDLGRPGRDRLDARGAAPGDRVCVFEPAADRLGCATVTRLGRQIVLHTRPDWQPEIVVAPVSPPAAELPRAALPYTLTVEVRGIVNGPPQLQARLAPADDAATPPITLVRQGGVYRGAFGAGQLAGPVFEGFLQVWVDEAAPRREAIVDFNLGGNPGARWARTAPKGNPGARWARTAPKGNPGARWARTAPVVSSDGNLIVYSEQALAEGEFYAVQAAADLPDLKPWHTPVGQAYRLTATAGAGGLARASVTLSYLERDVPEGAERWLRLYHYDEERRAWVQLPTSLSEQYNQLSAPLHGPGLYAVFAAVQIELDRVGYNLVGYPMDDSRPLGEALASIAGKYTLVYGYNAAGATSTERWPLYSPDPATPDAVNTLRRLSFGQGYFIRATEVTTVSLGFLRQGLAPTQAPLSPPASYYGTIAAEGSLAVQPGEPVIARVGGVRCGEGRTLALDGQLAYQIAVEAGEATCGAAGRVVAFEIRGQRLGAAPWDDTALQRVDLALTQPGRTLYLPFVGR